MAKTVHQKKKKKKKNGGKINTLSKDVIKLETVMIGIREGKELKLEDICEKFNHWYLFHYNGHFTADKNDLRIKSRCSGKIKRNGNEKFPV